MLETREGRTKSLTDDCANAEEAKRERVTQVFITLQKGTDVFTVDDDEGF